MIYKLGCYLPIEEMVHWVQTGPFGSYCFTTSLL